MSRQKLTSKHVNAQYYLSTRLQTFIMNYASMLNTCLLYYSNLTKTIPLYIKWLFRKFVQCTFCLLYEMCKEHRLERLDQDQQEHESQLYKRSDRLGET